MNSTTKIEDFISFTFDRLWYWDEVVKDKRTPHYQYYAICHVCKHKIYGTCWDTKYTLSYNRHRRVVVPVVSEEQIRNKCWRWIHKHMTQRHTPEVVLLKLTGRVE